MSPIRLGSAGRWLLSVLLVLLLLWLALPRLLGMAAERWLAIPGLEGLHLEIDKVGTGHARLSEARAIYQSAGGHRFRIGLRDIALDYSLISRHIERLDIASGELEILPGQTQQTTPWPQLAWPHLPLSEAVVGDLRVTLHWPQRAALDVHGNFHLRQTEGQLQAEFRPDGHLLRSTAISGDISEFHLEWLPATGPGAQARLHVGRQPAQQPARLDAEVPLPVLLDLGRTLGIAMPLGTAQGALRLKAEALLGEEAGSLRALSGQAEFTDSGMQFAASAVPQAIAFSGKLAFAWQPSGAQLELQPGLRGQVTIDSEQSLQVSSQLDKAFVLRVDNGATVSEGEFPFTLDSPRWGRWDGAVHHVRLNGGAASADWKAVDAQVRIKGQLKQWQRDAIQIRDLQATGDMALHWSRSAGLSSELALQLGVERLAWSRDSPLTMSRATWKVKAEATAKADDSFWASLLLHGEASSPQLTLRQGTGQVLTLGASRLQLLQLRPNGTQGAQGELMLAVDALRFGSWPSPAVRTRLRLDAGKLRSDGTVHLQGTEVLRFAGSHALARGCGEATLSGQQALLMLGKLLQPRPPALLPLELQAGELDARFTLDWCTRPKLRFDAKGTLQARDATLGWDRARVEAVQTRLQLDGLYPLQGRIQLSAPRGVLATGTALADLNVDLALATKALTVHALDVALLGGTLHSAPQSLPWPSAEQAMPLEIRHIDLGQLLALFKVNGLSGSGQVDGVVPLTYRNGSVEIHDGQVNSVGGGTIKYAPVTTIPDNPGLLALRNFHFQQLGMHLWYGSDGTYRTQVKLNGSNPDFYSGYPISFGLNINGALPGLFRAALFSGDFNRHILEQLQSGKLE